MNKHFDIKVLGMKAQSTGSEDPAAIVAGVVTSAASQEGVILHGRDVIGVNRTLAPTDNALNLEQRVQQAIHQRSGVSPTVVLYDNPAEGQSSRANLCALVGHHSSADSNVVLIQGAQ